MFFRKNVITKIQMINTSKHRVWSPKRRLVRNIPETFKGLGLSQQPDVRGTVLLTTGCQGDGSLDNLKKATQRDGSSS